MKTVTDVRDSFWATYKEFKDFKRATKRQNDYPCDIRCAFVDYVDSLAIDGQISRKLANRVTL